MIRVGGGLGAAVIAIAGCHADRVDQLKARNAALRAEVVSLRAESEELLEVLAAQPPPTRSERVDNDPEGFDPTRPLPSGHAQRPDVVLLSIDTLRADHLGAYGYKRDTSPFLDALAAEGTLFESAWSPSSWTLPSHTTMLSGWVPERHGAIEDDLRIPDDVPLLPEAFRRAGYGTFGAVATLFVSSRYGFERGFDTFVDFGILTKSQNNLSTVDADHVVHQALHWAQSRRAGEPLFLFLHVYDVHYNYDAPPPFNERFDRAPEWGDEPYRNYFAYKRKMISAAQLEHQVAQYDEEIAFVDHAFRELVETWRAAGRDLIVMVTADHGEEFGERGSWGHAHTLWPEQLHVPWIVAGPGIVAQRSPVRVGTEDIAPTLAGLAGVRFAAGDGQDRTRLLRGRSELKDPVAAQLAATSRFDSLVLRWHEPPYDLHVDVTHKKRALCHLVADPACATNIYRQQTAVGEAMFGRLMAHLGEPWRALDGGVVTVDEGYLFDDGERYNEAHTLSHGDTFMVLPQDAQVTFKGSGPEQGPWTPLGGTTPGRGCSLAFSGRATVRNGLVVSDDDREMLTQLGYLQDESEEQTAEVGPSGPEACR